MRRKVLVVAMTAAIAMTSVTGCGNTQKAQKGKDDSSYFQEVKKIAESKMYKGTSTMEMNFQGKIKDIPETEMVTDSEGKLNVSLQVTSTVESETKNAAVISVKLGAEETYSELTTLIVDEDTVYMNVQPIIEFVGKIDQNTADEMTTSFASMGIQDYVSVKLNALTEVMEKVTNESMNVSITETQDAAITFVGEVCDILAKDFADISGKEDGSYTLTFNKDNKDKAKKCVAKLMEEDAEALYDSFVAYAKVLYGEDSDTVKDLVKSKEENIKEMRNSLKESHEVEDAEAALDDLEDISVVSKVKADGKEGSRAYEISMDLKAKDSEDDVTMTITQSYKEAEVSIADKIPQNAVDMTVLINSLLSQYTQDYSDLEEQYSDELPDLNTEL